MLVLFLSVCMLFDDSFRKMVLASSSSSASARSPTSSCAAPTSRTSRTDRERRRVADVSRLHDYGPRLVGSSATSSTTTCTRGDGDRARRRAHERRRPRADVFAQVAARAPAAVLAQPRPRLLLELRRLGDLGLRAPLRPSSLTTAQLEDFVKALARPARALLAPLTRRLSIGRSAHATDPARAARDLGQPAQRPTRALDCAPLVVHRRLASRSRRRRPGLATRRAGGRPASFLSGAAAAIVAAGLAGTPTEPYHGAALRRRASRQLRPASPRPARRIVLDIRDFDETGNRGEFGRS